MQEPALADPPLLVDDDAVHDRDLAGRAAEDSAATRSQTRNASPKETPCAGCACGTCSAMRSVGHVRCSLRSLLAGSSCAFRPGVAAPGVERVVHHHAVFEHLVVVREVGRQAERDREQARRLRRQVEPGGVGAAHDQRERVERRVLRCRRPRGTRRSCSARRHARTARRRGCRRHVAPVALATRTPARSGRNRNSRLGIDEAADQPGAGDAVDLGALAGDPAAGLAGGLFWRRGRPSSAHAAMPPSR